MAKYKQTFIYNIEDSFGQNEFDIIIASSINLLTDETEATEIDNLFVDKIDIAFQSKDGGLRQDSLSLISADYLIENEDEQNCLDLLKSCLTDKIYCAIILNKNTPLQNGDILFLGELQAEYEEEAKKWNRYEYSETAEIKNGYKFEVISIVEATFDEISMKDIISQISLDSAWITSNVGDKQGWRNYSDSRVGVDYEVNTYCADLVNLNKLLRKIGDEAVEIFNTINSTSYTLNFKNRVKLTGKYAPARWRVSETNNFKLWIAADEKRNPNDDLRSLTTRRWDNTTLYHNLDDATDFRDYYIDPDEIETFSEDDSLWVDAKYFIELGNENEYSKTTALSYRVGGNGETFADFLYKIAANFGFLLILELNPAEEEINVTFVNSEYIEDGETLYFKDADKCKRTIVTGLVGVQAGYYGESFYNVGTSTFGRTENRNTGVVYGKDSGGVTVIPELRQISNRNSRIDTDKGSKLLFTITPTISEMSLKGRVLVKPPHTDYVIPSSYITLSAGEILPHNTKVTHKRTEGASVEIVNMKDAVKVGDEKVGFAFTTRSLHTGLYVKVPQKETFEPTNYFTPIRAMAVKIDNEEQYFDNLEAFLNISRLRQFKVSSKDIEINLPYWNAFSTSSDGSNPSLKNLKLGKKITLNSISYIVKSIKIDLSKVNVNIGLQVETLFSEVKNPTSPKTTNSLLALEDLIDEDVNSFPKYYVDGETDLFSALCYTDNEDVKTITTAEEANRFFGLAIESKENDFVQVLEANGEYDFFTTGFNIGDILYLRADGTTTNVGTSPANTYHSATDCVYLKVAEIVRTNRIKVFDIEPIEFSETNF